jgi:cytochrome c oxidase assembly protein subunit 15
MNESDENSELAPELLPSVVATKDERTIALWLWIVAGLIFLMVLVGGATRLTESGLSITEWRPVAGALPPLSEQDWMAEFEKYKQTTQYKEINTGMSVSQFKKIYLWEWAHRLLGRLIGVVFALPFFFFWVKGALPSALRDRLFGVLALGALQGAVGWWMVKSGLVGRTEVAQERLAIHLLLASLTLAAVVWLAVGLKPARFPLAERTAAPAARGAFALFFVVLLQIVLGALVAGLRAGYIYDTWPLMDGRFIPPLEHLFLHKPAVLNFVDNPTMVQFIHRMTGYFVALVAAMHALQVMSLSRGKPPAKRALALLAMVLAQIALGVMTLLTHVQLHVALTHQAVAMAILIMTAVQLRRITLATQD